jgi:hypothetical protein
VRAVAGEPLSLEKCVKRTDIAKAPTWRMRSLFEMANWSDPWATAARTTNVDARGAAYDAGLRSYMLSVYNYMASGVLLTGVVALLFACPVAACRPQGRQPRASAGWSCSRRSAWCCDELRHQPHLETTACKALFWAYAVLMGLSLSTIFLVYTGASIAQTFFASAAAFGGLSLWGYTTKRDLSALRHLPDHGRGRHDRRVDLINMFLQSSALEPGDQRDRRAAVRGPHRL